MDLYLREKLNWIEFGLKWIFWPVKMEKTFCHLMLMRE